MNDFIYLKFKKNIRGHWTPGRPVLIGFSGGPDSLALLHMLVACAQEFPIELHVAHVDHGWREESEREATFLKNQVEKLGLPFYSKRLAKKPEKNLEEEARNERLSFFQTLYKEKNFQALILAHHRDDQAETVLKRLFESSFLPNVKGLESISALNGMQIWRPFLTFSKKELLQWLEERSFIPLVDSSNEDFRFLRTRLRKQIFPLLEEHFGKNVAKTLSRIGAQAAELKIFLDKKTSHWLNSAVKGPFGFYLDFSKGTNIEKLEFIHLLKRLGEERGTCLTCSVLDTLWNGYAFQAPNKKIILRNAQIIWDRGVLFWLEEFPSFLAEIPLKTQIHQEGKWRWTISCLQEKCEEESPDGWKSVWKGEVIVHLPRKIFMLGPYKNASQLQRGGRLKDFWRDQKVPAFLRYFFPLVWEDNKVAHEFLTQGVPVSECGDLQSIKISVEKNVLQTIEP